MKRPIAITISVFFLLLSLLGQAQGLEELSSVQRPAFWAYDPGPQYLSGLISPEAKMAKELIDLHAEIPNFPGVSEKLMRHSFKGSKSRAVQKFRPAYGPIPWRMPLTKNSVKILFIGQDGTHVAEAAGRPATAGFGGRAQDLAAFFGVEYSAGFINTYAFTIQGQYGARGAPYVLDGRIKNNETIIPNDIWLMTQDQDSPIQKWRSHLIEWIIRNNPNSLKLIVLFGGSAKDSIASFIESRGGKVGSQLEPYMSRIQVPEFKMEYAGGNGEYPVPVNEQGDDAYEALAQESLNYSSNGQKIAEALMQERGDELIEKMFFTLGGPYGNGLLHHAQMGGYDLDQISIEDHKATRSLKGLTLSTGEKIQQDILVVSLPHPTYLSNTMNTAAIEYWESELATLEEYQMYKGDRKVSDYQKLEFLDGFFEQMSDKERSSDIRNKGYAAGKEKVARLVEYDVAKLRPYADKGWYIEPDASDEEHTNKNYFAQGQMYSYGRSDIHFSYYDFGTPNNRMVSKSTARRGIHKTSTGKNKGSQIIIFGSRDVPKYDKKLMDLMLEAEPNTPLDPNQMFVSRVRTPKTRYIFDPGPGEEYAKLLKNLDYDSIYQPKEGMSFSSHGIDAYSIKSHPSVGDFGHYRGDFNNPRVLILADPDGYDDLITARALTGTRGQYLHGLMEDLGVKDQYLVIKTLPFGMDGASDQDWKDILGKTKSYRDALINTLLDCKSFELILSDGMGAQVELERILKERNKGESFIRINRVGTSNNSGIQEAGELIQRSYEKFHDVKIMSKMQNIPKSHLSYYARAWEGTSGDRVLDSQGKDERGLVFQEVVPDWVVEQDFNLSQETEDDITKLLGKLWSSRLPLPYQSIEQFIQEKNSWLISSQED